MSSRDHHPARPTRRAYHPGPASYPGVAEGQDVVKPFRALAALFVIAFALTVVRPASADEAATVYDRRGRIIATFQGAEHSITVVVTARWRDGRLIHSHGDGASANLSPADLDVARFARLKAICAQAGGVTCCAERIGPRWPGFDVAAMTRDIHNLIDYQPPAVQASRHYAYLGADSARGYTYGCF